MFLASEICGILRIKGILSGPDTKIRSVCIDSRQVADGESACFVALPGLRNDGHRFLSQAWQSGIRNFIVNVNAAVADLPDSNVFAVPDTVQALQMIARAHREKFSLPCIGITGSNGKTWVKEWLYQLLSPEFFIVKSPRSYNSQIGVPLSVLQIRKEHTLGIFEAGISLTGEMSRLADIIQPEIGILTHMGDAHQAGFSSMEQKLAEKLQLFKQAQTIYYCADEEWIDAVVKRECKDTELMAWRRMKKGEMLPSHSYGRRWPKPMATGHGRRGGKDNAVGLLVVRSIEIKGGKASVSYSWNADSGSYEIPFADPASVENSITCCLLLLNLGYAPGIIASRMKGLHSIELRLTIHQLPGNSVLINDAYNLDIGSLSIALETLKQHSAGMQRSVVVSDIDHQHGASYAAMAELFSRNSVNHVFGIGAEIGQLATLLPQSISFTAYKDLQDFVTQKPWRTRMPGAFLLKGARNFHFEQLAGHMQGRYHSAVLEIDLNTLLHNLQFFSSRLHPKTKIIAMVKAAAYGSGGAEIARFLAFHNISILAVAYIDEGIELRDGGVNIPILVMNPDPSRVDQMHAYNLEPEVFDFSILEAIGAYYKRNELRMHIKVDTGMHRLGFKMHEIPRLIEWIQSHREVHVASVFTHLAAAGDANALDFTHSQVRTFDHFYQKISDVLGYSPDRHVLNTSGVLHFPEYQYEAVRLGIGLYGAGAEPGTPLRPVHTLKARISQIHDINANESVGYDRAYTAKESMRIGTINIGYADGLRRCAGHEKYAVHVDHRPAPILGKVCMDMTMINLREHPEARPGDEVIIFGPDLPVDELARVCDTIPYEILTGISPRVARVLLYS